jgi:hypothetical protein
MKHEDGSVFLELDSGKTEPSPLFNSDNPLPDLLDYR